jgi:magnesium-transporting ATPase (P-type)
VDWRRLLHDPLMYAPSPLPNSKTVTNIEQSSVELGVQKTFEFVSNLRRASVIVRQFGQKSGDIFVKGAPEAMKEICRPESCKYPGQGSRGTLTDTL